MMNELLRTKFPPKVIDGPQEEGSIIDSNPIVNSVTNDEEDEMYSGNSNVESGEGDQNFQIDQKVGMNHIKQESSDFFNQERESYLIRYEQMIMEQEKEQNTAFSHVESLLGLLEDVLPIRRIKNSDGTLIKEVFVEDLKQAYRKIKCSKDFEMIKSDKQFMMVLDIICEETEWSSDKVGSIAEAEQYHVADIRSKRNEYYMISWPEIIQCYRICVIGMQTLQMIGSESTIRERAKERTLSILSLYKKSFYPKSTPSAPDVTNTNIYNESIMKNEDLDKRKLTGFNQWTSERYKKKPRDWFINNNTRSLIIGVMVMCVLFMKFPFAAKEVAQYQETMSKLTDTDQYLREANSSLNFGTDTLRENLFLVAVTGSVAEQLLVQSIEADYILRRKYTRKSNKDLSLIPSSRTTPPSPRTKIDESIAVQKPLNKEDDNNKYNNNNHKDNTSVAENRRSNSFKMAFSFIWCKLRSNGNNCKVLSRKRKPS